MFHFVVFLAASGLLSNLCASRDLTPKECEAKETSIATLDLVEESISKAKAIRGDDLCNVITSKCDREKRLGYLNVALTLVTDAKRTFESNLQIGCLRRHQKPMDCSDVLENGCSTSGVYTIWPRSRILSNKPIQVYCDMDTDGGGWTLIQRRGSFSKQEDFYVNWYPYKIGFGNLSEEFWIGNDNIFSLSNQGLYEIRFDLKDVDGSKAFALYHTFWIEEEKTAYKLHIENYTGDAGDSMTEHNLQLFSTKDWRTEKSVHGPCADVLHSGWWYFNCGKANPNGLYQPGTRAYKSAYWYNWKEFSGLAGSEIKIRRR